MTVTDPDPSLGGVESAAAPGAKDTGTIRSWIRTHPGMVVALLVPVVVFGLPQLAGGTFLTGDNLIQNLPMRALVGWDLDHGLAPVWNPYLFSGTPLLGGFNAGAAYPVTWLTAVLPLFTAWTLTLIIAYDVALAGMYLFLRRQPLSATAATFGAVSFAFAGYMSGQMVHIDLIAGAAWLPWILLSVHTLTGGGGERGTEHETVEPDGRQRHTLAWVLVLAVSVGLSILAGNAEAVIDSGVLVTIYLIGRLITSGRLRRGSRRTLGSTLAALAAGTVGGIALGTAQWLPGLVFLSQSQRSSTSYSFFTSGSLDNRLLSLIVSPFILGSNQNIPGMYTGDYNFPEVTSYLGIFALIAACSLFLRRWRTRPEARQWWVWYVILVVGLASALGGQTPFGHVLYLIPGLNSERLVNRNLLLVDVALAVLLAWWVHLLVEDRANRPAVAPSVRSRWRNGPRSEIVVTVAPVALMGVLCAALWVDGPLLDRLLDAHSMATLVRVRVAALVTAQLVVAAWATWIVLSERRWAAKRLVRLLSAALVADLVLFNCFVLQPPINEAQAQAKGPTSAAFASLVGNGRFIIYDPDRLYGDQLIALGQTDLNMYGQLPSAQGYTALTDGNYYDATGSHYQQDLNPETLAGPVWDGLNVTTLLSVPGYFLTPVPQPSGSGGSPTTIELPTNLGTYRLGPAPLPDTFALSPRATRQWYFGGVLTVRDFQVPVLYGSAAPSRVGLVGTTGAIRWLPAGDASVVGSGGDRTLRVSLPKDIRAAGIVAQAPGPQRSELGVPEAQTVEAGDVALNGRMQFGVTAPHWRFTGMFGPFGVFSNTTPAGWAYLAGAGGVGGAPPGSAVAASAPGRGGGATIPVHLTAPASLVRSAAWSTGWQASVRSVRRVGGQVVLGAPVSATVTQDGVLQRVWLPAAGDYRVTFRYAPAAATVGIAVSAGAAAVVLVAALAGWFLDRRRRRPDR